MVSQVTDRRHSLKVEIGCEEIYKWSRRLLLDFSLFLVRRIPSLEHSHIVANFVGLVAD
jgi:hypothetical protein